MMIIGRTDAIAVEGCEAAMDRMNVYLDAGADIAFVEAPRTVEQLAAVPPRLSKPALADVFEGGKTPQFPAKQLESTGYRLGIYPLLTHRAAIFAAKEVLELLKREGARPGPTKTTSPASSSARRRSVPPVGRRSRTSTCVRSTGLYSPGEGCPCKRRINDTSWLGYCWRLFWV